MLWICSAKDKAGTFMWGFVGIDMLCIIGVALSMLLARTRAHALAAQQAGVTPAGGKM